MGHFGKHPHGPRATGTLYAADIDTDTLYTIDPSNGQTLTSVAITPPLEARMGMEWDNANSYLIVASDDTLCSLDPATGVATSIVAISVQDLVNDLAFFPTCTN
jgi:DNA-binding beta-propeller fold protein YncE